MQNISELKEIISYYKNGCITRGEKFRLLIGAIINSHSVTDEKMVYLGVCWLRDNNFPLVAELRIHIQFKYGIDLFKE